MGRAVYVLKHSATPLSRFLTGLLRERRLRARVIRRDVGEPLPDTLAPVVVLGGPMAAYEDDRYPFLGEERAYLARLVDAGEPVLGICLGAHLLAQALGAVVYPGGATEIGWQPVELTAAGHADPLVSAFAGAPRVMQWHGDTFELPPGAAHLARSPRFGNQAFRYGGRAYGIQFHPEVDEGTVRAWIAYYRDHPECGRHPGDAGTILRETARYLDEQQRRARRLFGAFFDLLDGAGRT